MSNANLHVGYSPVSPEMTGPGDRRRFLFYSARRGIRWERCRPGDDVTKFDVLHLSALSDLTFWQRQPRSVPPIIYDMPDSYLAIDDRRLQARLRGPAKFVLGQHSHFVWQYKDALKGMFRRANAVTCSIEEQRAEILQYNSNVHPVLDFHTNDASVVKHDYTRKDDAIHILWEGIGGNLIVLREVEDVLINLARRFKIVLHLVTDLWQRPFNAPVPELPTRRYVRQLRKHLSVFMYDWNPKMLGPIATQCDLALIPIVMSDPLYVAKPENKLLLLWRMGIPTVTSPTPAYVRTMEAAGIPMYARSQSEWRDILERYFQDEAARRDAGTRGREFAEREQGESELLRRWDAVYDSVLG